MSDLQLFLDHWLIYRKDGSHVLNGKYSDFYKELKSFIQRDYSQEDNWDNPVFRERYMKSEHYWDTRDENKVKEQTIESQRLSKETF